jgi:hypothetical protein
VKFEGRSGKLLDENLNFIIFLDIFPIEAL